VVLDHLAKELDTKGMLMVPRQGSKCYGKKLRVCATKLAGVPKRWW
jgi:type I restriction enzyme R subunit